MKKRLKLKGWVKVVITIILVAISMLLYSKTGTLGELTQTYKIHQLVCIGVWGWLIVGQTIAYSCIWSK